MSNEQTILTIKTLLNEVLPQGSEAILFGSRARGDFHNGSDWDILILLDKNKIEISDHDNYSYPLRELGWDINEEINPIIYTKTDWEDSKHRSMLYFNIKEDGIKIWG